MFSHATPLDLVLMVIAALLATLHGAVLPVAMLVFGLLTNAFVNQYSSAQLANYELSFDPTYYIENGRFAAVDFRVVITGFINFTNITGGVVNCSDSYELLPFNQSFDDILQLGVTQLASCLDNPTFLAIVNRYIAVFVGLAVASWLLGGAHVALFSVSGLRQVARLRDRLFASVVRQELAWFDGTSPGDLMSRLTQDVGRVQEGLGEKLGLLLQWTSTLVAGVIVSMVTEWRLTLLMTFAGILIALSTAILSVVTALSTSHTLSLSATASAVAEEALVAVATVKAYCAEEEESERYNSALRKVRWRGQGVGVVSGVCLGVVQLLVFSCYAGSLWLGAYLVQEELIQAGEFVTVFFAVLLVGVSIGQALPHVLRLIAAERAANRLSVVIARVPLIPNEGVWPEKSPEPAIEFRNVTFCYPSRPEAEVLKNVSFTISPGQTVAVVGATGSGKSTIGHLLMRLYDVTGGQALVGGYNVSELLTKSLRGMVGVVSQDPALFQTTIADNIRFGSEGGVVTQSDIEIAARQALAHNFISQLPQGYNTVVGSRGSQLSGGQKQRIAIARALVRNPRILLLDKATSALDTESEKRVQEALDKAREGRTTIIIAHRLSTVTSAEKIIVMEGGVVMEMGSHDQLLRQEGVYYNLVNAQLLVEEGEGEEEEEEEGEDQSTSPASSQPLSPQVEWNGNDQMEQNEDTLTVSWLRVLRLSISEWPVLVAGVIAAGVTGAIFPSFSIFFGEALEVFTYPFNLVFGEIHKWAWLFLALGFASAVATVIKVAAFSIAGEQLTYRLRCQAFRRILRHPMSWFDKSSSAGAAAVLSADPPLVQGVITSMSSVMEVGVGLVTALVIAMVSSWTLALVIMGFIPLLVIAGLVQVWLLNRSHHSSSTSTQVLLESVTHMRTVQLFGLEERFIDKHRLALTVSLRRRAGETLGLGCMYGFTNFILLMAYAVTFRFAAYLLTLPVDHTLYTDFNEVFTVFIAIILGSVTAGQASVALPLVTQATAAAARILGLMAALSEDETDDRVLVSLEMVKGALSVNGVAFSFPSRPAVRVLSELSVAVAPDHSLALVGPSGAGKSTVFSLLLRLYVPSSGHVMVGNTDINRVGLSWWRRQLGWVPQDVILFNRSVTDNIAYGCRGEVDDKQIEAAAMTANIHSFIMTLPQGYNTVVGSRGSQLSGGQKQRIAIARALVRNPKILLLDEATSALDTESEKRVQEALDKAREGRTTIIIAHRLSTVAKADHIAVVQAGRVVEEGNHSLLLKKRGIYWRLVQSQHGSHDTLGSHD